jgi:hypothetical protein
VAAAPQGKRLYRDRLRVKREKVRKLARKQRDKALRRRKKKHSRAERARERVHRHELAREDKRSRVSFGGGDMLFDGLGVHDSPLPVKEASSSEESEADSSSSDDSSAASAQNLLKTRSNILWRTIKGVAKPLPASLRLDKEGKRIHRSRLKDRVNKLQVRRALYGDSILVSLSLFFSFLLFFFFTLFFSVFLSFSSCSFIVFSWH